LVRRGAAQGQDGAARLAVEHARVGGRPAFVVLQPAFRYMLALVEGDTHLAFGDNAGADVEDDWLAATRRSQAEWVGADAGLGPAGRSDAATETVIVDRRDEGHALVSGLLGVLPQTADVSAVLECPR